MILLHVQSSDETPCYYIGDKQRIAYIRIGNEKKIIDAYKRYEQFPNYRAPEFTSNASEFHVTLWNLNYEQFLKDVTKELKDVTKDPKEFTKDPKDVTKEGKDVTKEPKDVTKERKDFLKAQRKIYRFVSKKPNITTTEMGERMRLTKRQVLKYIKRLTDMNLIVREGGRKTGVWRIIDKDYDSFFEPQ